MTDTQPDKSTSSGLSDWANRTTAVLAVLAALSSGQWGASNLRAILEQGKVNDTWAYYQSDSIKEHGAKQMQKLVEVLGHGEPDSRAKQFASLQKDFAAEAADKDKDKKARFADAQRYEASRDRMVERSFWFEISFASIQLGVVLCTIAAAAKNKLLWIGAMLFGIFGMAVLANGIHPFKHAPKSWYESTSTEMAYEAPPHESGK